MERFTRELASGLLAHDHLPQLITSHPGRPSRTVEDGLPIIRVPRPPQERLLRRQYEPYLTHIPFSYGALRAGSYDVAHAVHTSDAIVAGRWKRHTGRPAVLSFMGIPDRIGLRGARKRLELVQRALRDCDAVVALSGYAAEAFRYWLGYEAPVIEPGVNLDAFAPAPARAKYPTIVCSAAPEVARKNIGLLVQAFKLVQREAPDARLVLSRPPDLDAARRAGVDVEASGIEWANLDDRSALARAYGEAWVAVLPSAYEAFGLVLVEAMACGTPVVGYDDAAIPELIDRPEVGRLFDRLTPEVLAAALLEVMELSAAADTIAQCRRRAEEFSSDRCAVRYVELYRELGAGVG
jgi:phosphatidyl-myo-inositol alpha-mannosyltransferase